MTKKKDVRNFGENRREDFLSENIFPHFCPPIFVTQIFAPPIFMTSLRRWSPDDLLGVGWDLRKFENKSVSL